MPKKLIEQERRARYLESLISESVINVLAEQEVNQQAPVSATPPSPVQPSQQTNQPPPQEDNQEQPANGEEDNQFTVDGLVDKLNVLRGGKSFTDPEVFGRLTTFFNNLSEEQKTNLNYLLSEMGKIVIGVSEEQAGMEHDPSKLQQGQKSQAQQPPPPKQQSNSGQGQASSPAPLAPV